MTFARNISRIPKWERYRVNEVTGCWVWIGSRMKNGYARLDGTGAHRVYYEHFIGEIPAGLVVDHLCERRDCVNPSHLEAVTELENNRRRAILAFTGKNADECKHGHPMSGDNLVIYVGKNGTKRKCRQCDRNRNRTGVRKPYSKDDVAVIPLEIGEVAA